MYESFRLTFVNKFRQLQGLIPTINSEIKGLILKGLILFPESVFLFYPPINLIEPGLRLPCYN